MSSSKSAATNKKKRSASFIRFLTLFFCLLYLSSCGDFSAIFQKGQARKTSGRKGSSAHEKGKKTAGTKNRGKKGRVMVGMFIWPVDGEVSSRFGQRGGRPHDGIDIRAEKGDPIYAAADGEVVYSGSLGGYGNLILIEHRNKYFTAYAHNEKNLVKEGRRVDQGDLIAKVGATGHATGPHLHFEIRHESTPMDPVAFLPSSSEPTLIGRREVREEPAPEAAPVPREVSPPEVAEEPKLPIPYDL